MSTPEQVAARAEEARKTSPVGSERYQLGCDVRDMLLALASQRATIERLERALAKYQKVCDLLMNAPFITNHPEPGDILFNFWTHDKICEFIDAMAALSTTGATTGEDRDE